MRNFRPFNALICRLLTATGTNRYSLPAAHGAGENDEIDGHSQMPVSSLTSKSVAVRGSTSVLKRYCK